MTTTTPPAPTAPASAAPGATASARVVAALRRSVRGRATDAAWERPALLGLLLATAVLYCANLAANGWGNAYYAAAAQAGATDWIAFFYGSSDAANSITVDKPPASLWVMALSVRIFGLSSWSVLLPQALMGVATVGIVWAMVRRRFGAGAALLAGGVVALTPVATLMFRFDNPDALLVLLMTLAAFFTLRGIEDGRIRWVLAAGAMIGLAFLTKQFQAFLILPALALVYMWAAPRPLLTRIGHALAALGTVVVSAGWWVAIVELVPADARPYIGGSQTDSFLELTFGYNGLGRIFGQDDFAIPGGQMGPGGQMAPGGQAGPGGGAIFGEAGIARMFSGEVGGQIAWLLPAALALAVVGLVLTRREPRTSVRRGLLILATAWLLVTAIAFSFMSGVFHSYYTVALAPPIGLIVGVGAAELWRRRDRIAARATLAALTLITAAWAWVLLGRSGDWIPALRWVVLALGLVGAVLLLLPPRGRLRAGFAIATAAAAALVGPAAYSLETASTPREGGLVTAGPASASGLGGGLGAGLAGTMPGGLPGGSLPGVPGGGTSGGGGGPGGGALLEELQSGDVPDDLLDELEAAGVPDQLLDELRAGELPGGLAPPGGAGGAGAGMSGLLGVAEVSDELVTALSADAGSYTWIAATVGANSAAQYQLPTGHPVMPLGGFNGSDPSPTLEEFQELVAGGEIHWFIGGEQFRLTEGGSTESADIAAWVEQNFEPEEVGGVTIYDLTR